MEELPAGCIRVYRGRRYADSRASTSSFPETPEGGSQGSLDDAVDAVKSALQQATRLRMLRADVPVGSYLSGGFDSSLVAALGLRAKGSKFNTFSLRFEDAEYDETSYQRQMAAFLGHERHEIVATRADIAAAFPDIVPYAERPILRTAPAPFSAVGIGA